MNWPGVLGHERVFERFRRSISRGRLASTYLFVGPAGVGKRTTALQLAQSLLCEAPSAEPLRACGACPGCQQAAAQTHPDLMLLGKPPGRSFIPVELLIGDREHRMREGLCHDIGLKPFRGKRKIAIIDDADYLNAEGANSLLKTLEEPPLDSLLILIGTSEHRQLPTIRSRCQIVRFAPLSDAQLAQVLRDRQLVEDAEQAHRVASQAAGSLDRARQVLEDDISDACLSLVQQLGRPDFDTVRLTKELTDFVDAAGKDAPPRRARLQRLLDAAVQFYHQQMRQLSGRPATRNRSAPARTEAPGDPLAAADCLERCLEAKNQVDANANLATLIAAWVDDLAQARPPAARR